MLKPFECAVAAQASLLNEFQILVFRNPYWKSLASGRAGILEKNLCEFLDVISLVPTRYALSCIQEFIDEISQNILQRIFHPASIEQCLEPHSGLPIGIILKINNMLS